MLYQRTEGNPLFLVNLVEDFVAQGLLTQDEDGWVLQGGLGSILTAVPESSRHLIAQQSERLSVAEQHVLRAASVAGAEFSTAAVAVALEIDLAAVEEDCERLAQRQQFVRRAGISEWPDGTVAAQYSFQHAIYQQLWHERVSIGRRHQFHQRIGERLEIAYGEHTGEIAAELAVHFEQGRDYHRAVQYHQQAGENATRRHAPQEAIEHLTTALKLLKALPDTPKRSQQELGVQTNLGVSLMATRGLAAPEVGAAYARAQTLCQHVGKTPQLSWTLLGLWMFYFVRGELETAYARGEQLLQLAQHENNSTLLLQAHLTLGAPLVWLGELALARAHLEQGIALYDPIQHHSQAFLNYGLDPGVSCQSYSAFALSCLGYPDQANKRSREALRLAQALAHPHSVAIALTWVAEVHRLRGEVQPAQERAEALITLSHEQGFTY